MIPMAVSGHNGNNETLVGLSASIGLTIYDENVNEIQVKNSKELIEIFISRDIHLDNSYKFQLVNASQIKDFFMFNSFNVTSQNASIHIELKVLTPVVGYFMILKYGHVPIVNSTYSEYDSFKLLCPSSFLFIFITFYRINFLNNNF